jgi:hypothetical protein
MSPEATPASMKTSRMGREGAARSTGFAQRIFHRLRVLRDHREQHSRRGVRAGPALLPVSQGGWWKAELSRELRLTEAQLQPEKQALPPGNPTAGLSDSGGS